MALPGYRLRPGTVDRVSRALNEPTDTGLAKRLNVSRATITRARQAEQSENGAADSFVGHAMRVTLWPFQEFYEPNPRKANAA
ncbi:MAG: hypothetical protein E6Y12_03070 [Dermabacter sp.]|nr:hypothetical protein [Dermabacter sp.]